MSLVRDTNSNGVIQGFSPKELVEVNDGQAITFERGSVFMNEGAGAFAFNATGVGFYLQANVILVADDEGTTLTPQGASARFLVRGGYSVA